MTVQERKHPRYEGHYAIAECVVNRHESELEFISLICNYSAGGVCLHTTQRLAEGQKIRIRSKNLKLSETAIVRWFENESAWLYRVGLEFV